MGESRSTGDPAQLPPVTVPIAHVRGELSVLVERRRAGVASLFPEQCIEIEIPQAHHHIMVDQPLALVSAIRAVLAGWRIG